MLGPHHVLGAYLLAQTGGPPRRSYIYWMYQSLGPFYGLAIILTGLLVFGGACLVLARSRRAAVYAAYFVFVPLPLIVGVTGTQFRLISVFFQIGNAPIQPRFSHVADAIAMSLFPAFVGLLASWPSYLLLAIGLFVRTLWSREDSATR